MTKTQSALERVIIELDSWCDNWTPTSYNDPRISLRQIADRARDVLDPRKKMTDFQPKPQTPEQVDEGLRNAFRQAIKDGVMDATPYLKQMEPKIEIDPSLILKSGDCIYYHGIKYQKVVEPKSFYNKLWDLLKTKLNDTLDCDELTDEVMDLIKDTIPEPLENKFYSEIIQGYNTAIKDIVENF